MTAAGLATAAVSRVACPFGGSTKATIKIGFDTGNNLRWECTHTSPDKMHCWVYGSGVNQPC